MTRSSVTASPTVTMEQAEGGTALQAKRTAGLCALRKTSRDAVRTKGPRDLVSNGNILPVNRARSAEGGRWESVSAVTNNTKVGRTRNLFMTA